MSIDRLYVNMCHTAGLSIYELWERDEGTTMLTSGFPCLICWCVRERQEKCIAWIDGSVRSVSGWLAACDHPLNPEQPARSGPGFTTPSQTHHTRDLRHGKHANKSDLSITELTGCSTLNLSQLLFSH